MCKHKYSYDLEEDSILNSDISKNSKENFSEESHCGCLMELRKPP
jgi:hypothetical protein